MFQNVTRLSEAFSEMSKELGDFRDVREFEGIFLT